MPDRDRPYMQFNFLVNLGGGTDPGSVQGGFQEVTGLSTELAQSDYRVGNAPHNNVINPTALFDWLNEVREGNPQARRTITVELQSEDHRTVARWTLNEARPTKYTLGALNAKGNDAAIEEFAVTYERLQVEAV
jgi:phage tail-like protein